MRINALPGFHTLVKMIINNFKLIKIMKLFLVTMLVMLYIKYQRIVWNIVKVPLFYELHKHKLVNT